MRRTLSELPSISLAELNDAAALMVRTDRKYVLPAADLGRLLGAADARVLVIAGRRSMAYDSTYFDTPDRASYHGAALGRRRRFKVRTRHYVDSDQRWLEVKTRGARGLTVKRRIPYSQAIDGPLSPDGVAFVQEELAVGGVRGVDAAALRAALVTRYRRSTLLLADHSSRVTIDQELTWTQRQQTLSAGDVVVVETKTSGGTPSGVDRWLWTQGHRPVRLSKYGTGMRLLDGALPGNRWTPVVRRQLAGFTPVTSAL